MAGEKNSVQSTNDRRETKYYPPAPRGILYPDNGRYTGWTEGFS